MQVIWGKPSPAAYIKGAVPLVGRQIDGMHGAAVCTPCAAGEEPPGWHSPCSRVLYLLIRNYLSYTKYAVVITQLDPQERC